MDEFPTKLDQMISFSFNFESLIKVLQLLNKKNTDLEKQVKAMSKRFLSIDKLREEVDDIHLKNTSFQNKLNDVEGSLANHSLKLLENDGKMSNMLLSFEAITTQTNDKFQAHDDNLNNLNRVLEEQVKLSAKQNERINEIEYNSRESIIKLNKGLDDIKSTATDTDKIKERFSEIISDIYELREDYEKKHDSLEKTIASISGKPIEELFPITNTTHTPINVTSNDDIERIQKRISELVKDNAKLSDIVQSQHEGQIEEFNSIKMKLTICEKKIKILCDNNNNNRSSNDNNYDQGYTHNNNENEDYDNNNNKSKNDDHTYYKNELERMNNTILQLHEVLMEKICKEEFNAQNNLLLSKIDTMNDKLKESLKNIDIRFKNNPINSISPDNSLLMGTLVDLESITTTIEKQLLAHVEEMIKDALSKLETKGDFSNNPTFYNITLLINKQKEDIDQAFKSIVNIRRIIGSNDIIEDLKDIKARLELFNDDNKKLYNLVNEIKREFEGEDELEPGMGRQFMPQGPNNIRTLVPIFQSSIKNNYERIVNLEHNQNNMTNEVKDSIKGSLRADIEKVIEQFQKNLNNFTNKFEFQLKNKIDQIGLTTFESKVNNRLSNEIKDKLDRGDLKKNNNVMNRKFDALENKISKTLVDTIIDLQMDEAPLIVKKNNKNIEKCASCNQVLQAQSNNTPYAMMNENNNMLMSSASMNKMRMSKYNIKDKDKLPDLSNKGHQDNNHNHLFSD